MNKWLLMISSSLKGRCHVIFGPRFFSQMNASPLILYFCIFVILMEGRIIKDERDDIAGGWRERRMEGEDGAG